MNYFVKEFAELTAEELYRIMQARLEVFAVEQAILYNDCDDLDLSALHVWLEDAQGLAAYCRILVKDEDRLSADCKLSRKIFIGRVLTMTRVRRQGLGKDLMKFAINAAREKYNVDRIFVSAQMYVKKFYEDLGFRQISAPYDDVGIEHIDMVCSL